jgi:hypothetical protein
LDLARSELAGFHLVSDRSSQEPSDGGRAITDLLAFTLSDPTTYPIGSHRSTMKLAWADAVPTSVIPVVVEVRHPVRLQVDNVFVGEMGAGERRTVELYVEFQLPKAPRVSVISDSAYLQAESRDEGTKLRVTVTAPHAPGRFQGAVRLAFGDASLPPLTLSVSGIVAGSFDK